MKIFLDSCVLIGVMKKKLKLNKDDDYYINPIVYAEIGYGFINIGRKLSEFDMFLDSRGINRIEIGFMTAKVFCNLKFVLKRELIADNDLLIASSCLEKKMKLWTLNMKHFERVDGLKFLVSGIRVL